MVNDTIQLPLDDSAIFSKSLLLCHIIIFDIYTEHKHMKCRPNYCWECIAFVADAKPPRLLWQLIKRSLLLKNTCHTSGLVCQKTCEGPSL